MMGAGAKQAAAEVGDSAGIIGTSLAAIKGGAKGAWNSLGALGKVGLGIAGVTAAVSLAVSAYQAYQQKQEELRVSAAQSIGAWRESYDSLNSQIDTITSLRNALDSNTLSEQEAYNAKSQLYSIQQSLSEQYGADASSLNLINGELQTQIDLINGIAQAEANRKLNRNEAQYDKATEMMESVGRYTLGYLTYPEYSDAKNSEVAAIQNVLDKYEDVITTEEDRANGTRTFYIDANAEDADEILNNFMADLRSASKEFEDSEIFSRFSDIAGGSFEYANEILDKYQQTYKDAQLASLVADKGLYGQADNRKSALDWMNDYTNAVQDYNDALASGDSSKIAKAADDFEKVDSSVQTLLGDPNGLGQYSSIFNEIGDQLNRAQIARNNLTSGLSNATGQFAKDLEYLKSNGFSDIDLKDMLSTEGMQKGETAFNRIIDRAAEFGLIQNKNADQVLLLIDALSSLNYVENLSSNALTSETQTVDTMRDSVAKAIDTQNNLTAALAAGNSATGMSAEQVKNVVDAFKDVKGFNIAELFENTATGVQMSADAFKKLNKNLQLKEQAKLLDAIAEKMQEYNDALESGDKSGIASATQDLIMLQAMLDEYNAATSKYNAYVTATSSANARDSYANVTSGYASVGQLIKDGWVTDDSVISYMELVGGYSWNGEGLVKTMGDGEKVVLSTAEAYAKLGETIAGTSSSLKDYLATDSKGNLTSQGVWQFAEDVFSVFGNDGSGIASMAADGTLSLNLMGENLQTVAERFGTTTDMVMLFGQALSNAGMTVDFGTLADQIGNIRDQIEQTQQELEKSDLTVGERSSLQQKLSKDQQRGLNAAIQAMHEAGTTYSEMLDMGSETLGDSLNISEFGIDQAAWDSMFSGIQEKIRSAGQAAGEIPLNVKIDEGQFNAMLAALNPETVQLDAEVGEVELPDTSGESVDVNANVNLDSSGVDMSAIAGDGANVTATIDYQDGSMPTEAPAIQGTANYNGVFPTSAPTISGTAVYTVVYQGGGGGVGGAVGGSGRASGTMTSIAHADGTAYNVLNYTRLTPSHAGGQVALHSDEYALTNEVG